ncbi:hypothetical protein [Pedobacter sp. MC2016-24]|uniref:hypothetical protein n=1 Tax=Pedobacter sp. MC2016-24 TaxID=2780090 RepID=UPI00188161E5|nr:hypothetical protein [Pedobacter sp. MC2016-24]MBE9599487.1 hypothetical protein [Pedobacter sp. MC2016-24]
MKENKGIVILSVVAVVIFLFVVYEVSTFSLFNESNSQLTEIAVPHRDYRLRVSFVPSNATSQDFIQVKKIEGETESVIYNYERYDTVVSYNIKGNMLRLILKNKHLNDKIQDTVYLKLD